MCCTPKNVFTTVTKILNILQGKYNSQYRVVSFFFFQNVALYTIIHTYRHKTILEKQTNKQHKNKAKANKQTQKKQNKKTPDTHKRTPTIYYFLTLIFCFVMPFNQTTHVSLKDSFQYHKQPLITKKGKQKSHKDVINSSKGKQQHLHFLHISPIP